MKVAAGVIGLALLLTCGACRSTERNQEGDGVAARSGTSGADNRGEGAPGSLVTGTVRRIDLEGGFYGIEADDGSKLDPVNLPPEFQKDGLRVRARVEPLKDRVSLRMWGSLVRLLSIERL